MELGFLDVMNQVQLDDLRKEEERVKADRDARKALKMQSELNTSMNISELLKELSGSGKDEEKDAKSNEPAEVVNVQRPIGGNFPAPPISKEGKNSGA